MPETDSSPYFRLFNEIGIIEQLSRTMFEVRLPRGIGVPQFSVLNHLVRVRNGQTPLALARAFQVPKTSMTHTLALLERANFVAMRPNPSDQRSKQVWLTEAGRAFRLSAIASLEPDLQRMAQVVPPDRIAALLGTLEEIRVYLDADRNRTS